MRRALFLVVALVTAGCDSTPKDATGWAKRALERNRPQEKLDALKEVRKAQGDKRGAVPHLVALLKDAPKIRAEAALALGEIKDASAAQPLIDAVDWGSGGSDRGARETNEANRRIAEALGSLRAGQAVSLLTRLAKSRDNYTQVAAVEALGEIGDPAGVETLIEISTSDETEPFTARKAIMALGRIGDPRATPAVMKMMFRERKGVSFFAESSFAAFQIGSPMAEPLLAVLKGEDKELTGWAKANNVVEGALYAKAAQVLGDIGDRRAVPALIQKLAYRDDALQVQYLVRIYAAESLGRMRAREAVRPIGEMAAKEEEPNARDRFCDALVRIGDREGLTYLTRGASTGAWDLREGPLSAISKIGDEREIKVIEEAQKSEPTRTEKECRDSEAKPEDCNAAKEKRLAALGQMMGRLEAAKTCKTELACWSGKLQDSSPAVRERAALEVGRAGDATHAQALLGAIVQPATAEADLSARYHALLALDWLTNRPGGLGTATPTVADKLDALVEQEKGRSFTVKVNEDVKRMAVKLRRAGTPKA
jgi:HEAT repeat protein